jgi:hypothetical protein
LFLIIKSENYKQIYGLTVKNVAKANVYCTAADIAVTAAINIYNYYKNGPSNDHPV